VSILHRSFALARMGVVRGELQLAREMFEDGAVRSADQSSHLVRAFVQHARQVLCRLGEMRRMRG
jgi:hypothetical protein